MHAGLKTRCCYFEATENDGAIDRLKPVPKSMSQCFYVLFKECVSNVRLLHNAHSPCLLLTERMNIDTTQRTTQSSTQTWQIFQMKGLQ